MDREHERAASCRRLIRDGQLRDKLGGVGRSTLWRWRRFEDFPAPVRLGPRLIAYDECEVEKWLASRERAS